ncbi:MAG TPA: orotate phosphoribosyltransferase [Candidatus Angelobacter sp.]|nr:orotate phosphoribosyltransferase [Candidatus Angelobacter sp.]
MKPDNLEAMNSGFAREQLLNLLAENSFRLGDFTLASGLKSDYYIDCRTTTLHAEGAYLTGRVFLDLFREQGWNPYAIGGLTMGADPIVVATSLLSSQDSPRKLVHGFLVRKAEKTHGMGRRIEGFQEKGAKVVIVDDVCTSGGSTIQAIEAAREFGFEVIGAACLVEREEAGGRGAVEKAAAPAPFISVFKSREVKAAHLKLKAASSVFAYSGSCEVCGQPASSSSPRLRCAVHSA